MTVKELRDKLFHFDISENAEVRGIKITEQLNSSKEIIDVIISLDTNTVFIVTDDEEKQYRPAL